MDYVIPSLLCDFYKAQHFLQYPVGTERVYSTWTPRGSRLEGVNEVVAFGFQAFIKGYLIDFFNKSFFSRPKADVVAEYVRYIKNTLLIQDPPTKHIEDLHDLGYLPVKICALPEGTAVPLRVPMLTIENTDDRFFWVTNYLESLMSQELWLPSTAATIAKEYRKILDAAAAKTSDMPEFVQWQGHDFSMRGMAGLEASMLSGAGHLLSFTGTDTIPAIMFLEKYYGANIEKELVGGSVPASEHSVACAYGKGNEEVYYKRLLTEVYPKGIVSIVSDTWDLWKVLTDIIAKFKPEIMARDGKCVIRPDSGDPVLIMCGDLDAERPEARKGVIEILWDIFGGTINSKGYKQLDSHIGAIYGDAITRERAKAICDRLEAKGFASTNIVFGIGSYTYQYNTRDTFGFALKSTWCKINGEEIQILTVS